SRPYHVGVSHLGRGQAVTLRRRVRFPYAHPEMGRCARLPYGKDSPSPRFIHLLRLPRRGAEGRKGEIMTNYTRHFSALATPQRSAARADQRMNNAGGYTFVLDLWARLDRWLVLGCEGGSYYASERKMTRENARTIDECLAADGPRAVARISEISRS